VQELRWCRSFVGLSAAGAGTGFGEDLRCRSFGAKTSVQTVRYRVSVHMVLETGALVQELRNFTSSVSISDGRRHKGITSSATQLLLSVNGDQWWALVIGRW
jgi:hypothetical protein